MPTLNENNSSIDESSGAVIFHKSPELKEMMLLREEVKDLSKKMDKILEILEGGNNNG